MLVFMLLYFVSSTTMARLKRWRGQQVGGKEEGVERVDVDLPILFSSHHFLLPLMLHPCFTRSLPYSLRFFKVAVRY